MVQWVVPQLMEAIDNPNVDVQRTLNRIIYGIMHHPAQREMGDDGARDGRQLVFRSVQQWWQNMDRSQQDDYRRKLSREGVRNGENHKEGVYDTGHGHGCSGKLQMRKQFGAPETWEDKVAGAAAGAIMGAATGAFSNIVKDETGINFPNSSNIGQAGQPGLEGMLGQAATGLLGFGKNETESFFSSSRNADGSLTQSETVYGHHGDRYGQAEYRETDYPDGRRQTDFQEYGQQDRYGGQQASGWGYEEKTEERPYGGGYQERTERREWEGDTQQSSNYGGYERSEETSSWNRQEESGGGWGRQEESGGSWGRQEESENRWEGGRNEEEREEEGGGFGDFLGQAAKFASGAFGGDEERREW